MAGVFIKESLIIINKKKKEMRFHKSFLAPLYVFHFYIYCNILNSFRVLLFFSYSYCYYLLFAGCFLSFLYFHVKIQQKKEKQSASKVVAASGIMRIN